MPELSEAQRAYFAGFFDGEGWISIVRRKKAITLMVGAAQCDPRPIQKLSEAFGGNISVDRKKRSSTFGKHIVYSWQLSSAKAEAFLRSVQPFLIHKQEQCEVALSFRTFIAKREGRKYGVTDAALALEREYADLLVRVRAETREKA